MKTSIFAFLLIASAALSNADQQQFNNLWYDGNAEISTYVLKESRYNEIRDGIRVMVFVTEPLRISTHIKPDVKLPADQMIKVIKLNDLQKFTTGIYDYSVMTSVFAAVENKAPYGNMATMKISLTSQEWCGQVFDCIVRKENSYVGALYSYFESEGETDYSIDAAGVETEDNLWLRVRELNGPFLREGETKKLRLIPSRWIIRKAHVPTEVVDATLSKGKPQLRETALGKIETVPFTWTINEKSTTVFVEHNYPHRIVEFRERDGSSGKLIASRREPYWKQNGKQFETLRGALGLPQ